MSWGAVVCSRDNSCNGVGSQQQQVQGQASVAEAEAAKGQTTINQKAVAIAAETVLVAAEMAAAMAVAAAMATVVTHKSTRPFVASVLMGCWLPMWTLVRLRMIATPATKRRLASVQLSLMPEMASMS